MDRRMTICFDKLMFIVEYVMTVIPIVRFMEFEKCIGMMV